MSNENTSLLDGVYTPSPKRHSARPHVWNLAYGLLGVALGMTVMMFLPSNHHHDASNSSSSTSPYKSRYTKVQGLGFQIYTGGAPAFLNNTEKNPECIGRNSFGLVVDGGLQCYIGNDDPIQDVENRVEIMKDAVDRAYQLSDKNATTLKVFIAPEFYWRGVDGAYIQGDPEACGAVCHILQSMEGIAGQKRFQDWLFVFGTVISADLLPTEDEYDYLFYNFAPVYKGYDPSKMDHHGKRFLVPKRYVSSSDFLTPQRYLNDSMTKELIGEELAEHDTVVFNPFDFHQKRYNNEMWTEYKEDLEYLGYTMIEYDWLIIDDISFTIEICFDHDRRTALNSYLADIVTGSTTMIPYSSDKGLDYVQIPKYQAQVSVVSSAGMTITEDSIALTQNGTIFLQDGLSDDAARMFWSTECQQGLEFEGGTEAVQRRAVLSNTDVFFQYAVVETYKKHHVYKEKDWAKYLDGAFSAKVYPPMITVYEPIDIAEVTS